MYIQKDGEEGEIEIRKPDIRRTYTRINYVFKHMRNIYPCKGLQTIGFENTEDGWNENDHVNKGSSSDVYVQ